MNNNSLLRWQILLLKGKIIIIWQTLKITWDEIFSVTKWNIGKNIDSPILDLSPTQGMNLSHTTSTILVLFDRYSPPLFHHNSKNISDEKLVGKIFYIKYFSSTNIRVTSKNHLIISWNREVVERKSWIANRYLKRR